MTYAYDRWMLVTALNLAVLCIVVAWVGERVRNAIRQGTAEAQERGLKRLGLMAETLNLRHAEGAEKLEVTGDNYLRHLVTGASQGIDQVIRMGDSPCPHLVGLGERFQECVFALDPEAMVREGRVPRRVRWHPVNALSGDLFAVERLEAVYRLLALRYGVANPALPRRSSWYLAVVQAKGGKR